MPEQTAENTLFVSLERDNFGLLSKRQFTFPLTADMQTWLGDDFVEVRAKRHQWARAALVFTGKEGVVTVYEGDVLIKGLAGIEVLRRKIIAS